MCAQITVNTRLLSPLADTIAADACSRIGDAIVQFEIEICHPYLDNGRIVVFFESPHHSVGEIASAPPPLVWSGI